MPKISLFPGHRDPLRQCRLGGGSREGYTHQVSNSDGRSFSATLIQDGILRNRRLKFTTRCVTSLGSRAVHMQVTHSRQMAMLPAVYTAAQVYSNSTEPTEFSNPKPDPAELCTVYRNHNIQNFFLRLISCSHHRHSLLLATIFTYKSYSANSESSKITLNKRIDVYQSLSGHHQEDPWWISQLLGEQSLLGRVKFYNTVKHQTAN